MTTDLIDPDDTSRRPDVLAEHFAGLIRRGLLCYPRGAITGQLYPLDRAPSSVDEPIDWRDASGEASLYSFAVYHQSYSSNFAVPYLVAHVELLEGLRFISTLIGCDDGNARIGMRLRAEFAAGNRLVFRPCAAK